MVCSPTLFAVAIPEDLALDLRAIAEGQGLTPETLVLDILRGRVKDWKHEPHAMEPTPTPPLIPPWVLEQLMTEAVNEADARLSKITRVRLAILEALDNGERTNEDLLAGLEYTVSQVDLSKLLARMTSAGDIRRVRRGVYGKKEE